MKAAADIYMPVSGEVVEVNEQLRGEPALANTDPLGNAFVYQMNGNTTYGNRAVSALLSFGIDPAELAGTQSNAYRWGDWVPVVYDWCYNLMTPSQRSGFISLYNGYTSTIMGKPFGGVGYDSNNFYWGYFRNALNWGIATYGENPMAATFIDDVLVTRWQNDFLPWAATQGAGGVPLEGSMYGREAISYTTTPIQTFIPFIPLSVLMPSFTTTLSRESMQSTFGGVTNPACQ